MRRVAAVIALLGLAGCDAEPTETRIAGTTAPSELHAAVPPGTAPRGSLSARAAILPPGPPMTRELLERGRLLYDALCAPCHGLAGNGDGVVVQRGFPAPPSLHTSQQQSLTRARIVEVTSDGTGRMYAMDEQTLPQDRWAIASYVKALQLSQAFPIDELPEDLRKQIE